MVCLAFLAVIFCQETLASKLEKTTSLGLYSPVKTTWASLGYIDTISAWKHG
jgi:hypothetical protein